MPNSQEYAHRVSYIIQQSTSTLKDALVLGIREDYANGMTQSKLAARHGITQSAVSRIVNRVSWSHL